MENRRLPPVVAGMAQAELNEFKWWLSECLSMDYDGLTADQLSRYAFAWIEEINKDYHED